MSNIIAKHSAVVSAINANGTIDVVIKANEACGSCSAQKVCGADNQKTLQLVNDNPDRQVGDVVDVTISRSKSFLAITLAYIIPVAIIVAALLIFQSIGVNEIKAGIITLVIVAGYFVGLKILNKYIQQQITINIE